MQNKGQRLRANVGRTRFLPRLASDDLAVQRVGFTTRHSLSGQGKTLVEDRKIHAVCRNRCKVAYHRISSWTRREESSEVERKAPWNPLVRARAPIDRTGKITVRSYRQTRTPRGEGCFSAREILKTNISEALLTRIGFRGVAGEKLSRSAGRVRSEGTGRQRHHRLRQRGTGLILDANFA